MNVVLDVSAAIEIVMGRPKQKLIASALKQGDLIIAPSLYLYESINTLWKYRNISGFSVQELVNKSEYLIKLVDRFIDVQDIYKEVLSLACEINHPAYDAAYLLLCRKNNADLLTLDTRLIKAAQKSGIEVVLQGI
jgi:predicted nucleic acid-binding protein